MRDKHLFLDRDSFRKYLKKKNSDSSFILRIAFLLIILIGIQLVLDFQWIIILFFIVSNAQFSFYFKSYDFKSDVHISSTRLVRNERARVSFLLFFLPPFMFCVGFHVHSKVEQHLSEMANNFPRQREEWPRQRLISLPFCSF